MKSIVIIAALCILNAAAISTNSQLQSLSNLELEPEEAAYRTFLAPGEEGTISARNSDKVLYPTVDYGVKRQSVKNYDVLENKHSRGQVAYFLDIMDAIFLEQFKADADKSYIYARSLVNSLTLLTLFSIVQATASRTRTRPREPTRGTTSEYQHIYLC